MSVNIHDIKLTKRTRRDIGDISALAANINEIGLLHPIVINEGNELICGLRRLEAFKKLGRKKIPCTIINLINLAKGEFNENVFRKDLTLIEMVEIKRALEPEIKERLRLG